MSEIFDINFRELSKKIFFAIINFSGSRGNKKLKQGRSRGNKKLKQGFASEEHLFNATGRCF